MFANRTDVKNHVDPDITWVIFCFTNSNNLASHQVGDANAVSYFQFGVGQVVNASNKTSESVKSSSWRINGSPKSGDRWKSMLCEFVDGRVEVDERDLGENGGCKRESRG